MSGDEAPYDPIGDDDDLLVGGVRTNGDKGEYFFAPPPSVVQAALGLNRKREREKEKKEPENSAIYVSNLPEEFSMVDFVEHFSKGGIFKKDDDGKPIIKFYTDEQGRRKGDALVVYFKRESVPLAITLLDESQFGNKTIRVAEATSKDDDKKKKKPKKKKVIAGESKANIEKRLKKKKMDQTQELGWEEGETRVHVVLKHMFHPDEAEEREKEEEGIPGRPPGSGRESFYAEVKDDITEEVKKLGEVDKVTVFNGNPEGVVVIKFKEPWIAEKCIQTMNDRFYAKRRIIAEFYDGVTNYKVKDQESEEKRLKDFEKWLEETQGVESDKDDGK
eukprot:TRINITY_DN3163_c0_g1_i1.p1 TRINITY_DN3163_c0_g1~~TRINITY_DN3163_c0_g1_i1.p1  ORF type:complete len:333 (-),score=133.86 TRINITY_DN3163_c0_g1_i1:256-1254(-)